MRFISTDDATFVLHGKGLYEMLREAPPYAAKIIETDHDVDWKGFDFYGPSVVVGSDDSGDMWIYCVREPLNPGEESNLFEAQAFSIGRAPDATFLAHGLNARHRLWESGLIVYTTKLLPRTATISIADM